MLSAIRLDQLLKAFPKLRIALLGDLFLDRYLEIESDVHELSIETGLEAYQVSRVRNSPGALGTVMNNLTALGVGRLVPITVIGEDGHAHDLIRELPQPPVDPSCILQTRERLTPTYTKPIRRAADGGWDELNRLDVRTRGPLSAKVQQRLNAAVEQAFEQADGLIVLDQVVEPDWGVVNAETRRLVAALGRTEPGKLIFVDSRAHLHAFETGILKGNRAEILAAACRQSPPSAEAPSHDDEAVLRAANQLAEHTGRVVFCTLGESGMLIVNADGTTNRVRGVRVPGPIDIVGAGDSATAALVASLLSGASTTEAAEVANLVASITVQQLGTTGTATPIQVAQRRAELTSC